MRADKILRKNSHTESNSNAHSETSINNIPCHWNETKKKTIAERETEQQPNMTLANKAAQ